MVPVISFRDLTEVPHRERPATKRKRISPPSYQLTSPEHIAFITASKRTREEKRETSSNKKAEVKAKKSARMLNHQQRQLARIEVRKQL